MTTRLLKATSGRPAMAIDFATNAAPGKFLKCVANSVPGGDPDVEFADAAFPAPAVSQQVFVAKFGSDVTGNGTLGNPYATLTHALATITDATNLKRYQVNVLPGEYIGNWTIKAFVRVVGYDPSDFHEEFYPAHLTGNVTLDASMAAASAIAGVTNIDIDGTLTCNCVAVGTANAIVTFSNCQLESDVTLTEQLGDSFEFHDCSLLGAFTQLGGDCKWYDCVNTSNGLLLVQAAPGNVPAFEALGGCWLGDITADQNGVAGFPVKLVLNNCSTNFEPGASSVITIQASAAVCPELIADYGLLPENTVLVGAAAKLFGQMRIHQQLTVPAGTAIGATGTTTVALAITAALLGTTGIETLCLSHALVGAGWNGLFAAKCSVNVQYVNPNVVNVQIYNPGAGFNTAADAQVTIAGYVPTV